MSIILGVLAILSAIGVFSAIRIKRQAEKRIALRKKHYRAKLNEIKW
ncbi:hypothetical protein H1164_13175 [Thermoactinomyces daqus]|uniref:Uncharacterized protein n=1 Tax=Thermoactinomyces daqus TaxID=1329516 RepID=A0A7W2AJ21_9BACL|nr:hypothetical protein [Thermoactinomyces daqus]MBA4543840.1 hypothetical protein [Thermoactinomyces daqus]